MNRRSTAAVLIAATVLAVGAVALSAQGNRPTIGIPAASEVLASCQGGAIYATPSAGSLIVGCGPATTATPTATTTPTITSTPSASATDGPSPTPTVTSTPDAQWWLAGGVDPADVVGAWRAKGAASYSDSLVNLGGGPDLYHPESAPTWTAAKGWQGGQHHHLAVTGGVSVTYGWSFFMKVRNARIGSQQFMGCRRIWNQMGTGMSLNNTGGYQAIESFYGLATNPLVLTGTMALAKQGYFVNGVARNNPEPSPTPGGQGCGAADLFILSMSWGGSPYFGAAHGGNEQTEVQGVAVYSDTLTAGQAAAIATAVGGW